MIQKKSLFSQNCSSFIFCERSFVNGTESWSECIVIYYQSRSVSDSTVKPISCLSDISWHTFHVHTDLHSTLGWWHHWGPPSLSLNSFCTPLFLHLWDTWQEERQKPVHQKNESYNVFSLLLCNCVIFTKENTDPISRIGIRCKVGHVTVIEATYCLLP